MKGRMGSSVCADVTQEQVRTLDFLIGHRDLDHSHTIIGHYLKLLFFTNG